MPDKSKGRSIMRPGLSMKISELNEFEDDSLKL